MTFQLSPLLDFKDRALLLTSTSTASKDTSLPSPRITEIALLAKAKHRTLGLYELERSLSGIGARRHVEVQVDKRPLRLVECTGTAVHSLVVARSK